MGNSSHKNLDPENYMKEEYMNIEILENNTFFQDIEWGGDVYNNHYLEISRKAYHKRL